MSSIHVTESNGEGDQWIELIESTTGLPVGEGRGGVTIWLGIIKNYSKLVCYHICIFVVFPIILQLLVLLLQRWSLHHSSNKLIIAQSVISSSLCNGKCLFITLRLDMKRNDMLPVSSQLALFGEHRILLLLLL